MLDRLRALIRQRKWVVWVALAVLLAAAFAIGVSLLPHSAINTFQQVENQSNGLQPAQGASESG